MNSSSSKFQFKTFFIEQNSSVFKVGTDAVLLGAWLQNQGHFQNVLEIGSGTGVISLCLFQKYKDGAYTAIDSNIEATNLTNQNFVQNGMVNYKVFHNSFEKFFENQSQKYDLIFSNPPYFVNDLIAEKVANIQAKHAIAFDFNAFFERAVKALAAQGKIALIFPFQSKEYLINLANKHQLFVEKICDIFPKNSKIANRFMVLFSIENGNALNYSLTIYNEDKTYTDSYKELTKDFYLKF
jgi:tRNA1Val (adenine37-N6)-methyltransferase